MLVLSRNYPSRGLPGLGIWAERLTRAAARSADPTVIVPIPWAPPLPLASASRFRQALHEEERHGIPVYYPRVLLAPGFALHPLDAKLMWPWVRRAADRLHADRPFNLIHAHFIYPDGVIAAALGRRYGIPVLTTEHALWLPWLERWPSVRRQVMRALPHIALVTAVSETVRRTVTAIAGDAVPTDVLPNVVDDDVFRAPSSAESWDPHRILFVGAVRHVKGLDLLVRALALVRITHPKAHLRVVGEAIYGQWRRDEIAVRRLVGELGLNNAVTFTGWADEPTVAEAMRQSAVLVVPGRRESFSAVAVEALASGTPVVATRCGGPEEILTPEAGRLVPIENPGALARAIGEVLDTRASFDRAALRVAALRRYGREVVGRRVCALYEQVLARDGVRMPP